MTFFLLLSLYTNLFFIFTVYASNKKNYNCILFLFFISHRVWLSRQFCFSHCNFLSFCTRNRWTVCVTFCRILQCDLSEMVVYSLLTQYEHAQKLKIHINLVKILLRTICTKRFIIWHTNILRRIMALSAFMCFINSLLLSIFV